MPTAPPARWTRSARALRRWQSAPTACTSRLRLTSSRRRSWPPTSSGSSTPSRRPAASRLRLGQSAAHELDDACEALTDICEAALLERADDLVALEHPHPA